MRALLVALLCSGCSSYYAQPDSSMSLACDVAPFASVTADHPVSCANLSINISIARDLMVKRGFTRSPSDFNDLYSDVSIVLHDERCISGATGYCEFGQYSENTELRKTSRVIDLDHDAVSLGHELMHHFDVARMGRSLDLSGAHDHWTQMGYLALAKDYQLAALPVME